MGKQADDIVARFAEGEDRGRLQWENPKLVFRGASRRVFEGAALLGVASDGGDLVLPDGSRFTLGAPFAARWAEAIANPPGRLAKLGVKAGQRIAVLDLDDPVFQRELSEVAQPLNEFSELDILFWSADSEADLARIPQIIPMLADRGALWIVSLKGKAAPLKDVQVLGAARAAGLSDTKVCGFSPTRTALRFVRRR